MERYSVFLTPSGADFDYTADLIREICRKYGGYPFEPHVTVYSGTFSDLDKLKKLLSGAVAGIRPFDLQMCGVGFSEDYFKSLYIEFKDNPTLREIHGRMRSGLETDSGYELIPHLSLLYSDMPLGDKRALAKRVVPDRHVIRFDSVKIVTPRNREDGWRDTGKWQALFRITLEEPGR